MRSRSRAEPVPGAAHGLDLVASERTIDLVAQVADVDVDDVGVALVREVPHVFDQLRPRQDLAGVTHQVFEERELARGELDHRLITRHAPGGGIELEVPDPEDRRPLGGAAPHQRAQARQQLGERERLGQVVVGTGVEARDPVSHGVARGEHEDRAPPAALAQLPADLEPVDIGQHQVQDDRVVGVLGPEPERVLPAPGHVDRVPLLLERALEQAGHLDLVLHDQHPHRAQPRLDR